MKTIYALTFAILLTFTAQVYGQEVRLVKFKELDKMMSEKSEKVRVFNFWATWCRPCVKELPYFEKLAQERDDVEVIFVSLDFSTNLESKVQPFVTRRKLSGELVLLDEDDANSWIPKIDPDWQGDIPATVIVSPGAKKRAFYAQEFTPEALERAVNQAK